ncbi:MAG: SbcC/MukB-like Walker B domain-containing protein [Saprospiraceae bacterium]
MNRSELTLFSTDPQFAGFRLTRFEAYNWGTFHKKVCALPLINENALLTGANGAGKTTLVDAIIALLNPTPERYFNQSAGFEDRKRTRKVEDYVRGVYGYSEKNREQLRDLPDEQPTYTVLLGVFYNKDLQQYYTLAHLYWIRNGELQKRFYTAPIELNVEAHFRFGGDIRAFNNAITKGLQAKVYDNFSDFAFDFQPKLGMRIPAKANNAAGRTKALHLLAKTAGIKVLGDLNAFIRDHMLDEHNMEETFDQLKKEYADIADTQQTLEKVTCQEQMLMPLLDINTQRLRYHSEVLQWETLRKNIVPWFARQHVGLLETAIAENERHLEKNQQDLAQTENELAALRKQETNINISIGNNKEGQRLQQLQDEKKRREAEFVKRRSEAERYAKIARTLDLKEEPDFTTFFDQQQYLKKLADQILDQKQAKTKHRDDIVSQKSQKEKAAEELKQELDSLRKRRNNLPDELIRFRARLSEGTGIPENELPFVGELVQVREQEQTLWLQALEKLLMPFSLYLLAPPRHLSKVVRWVRANNTGVLLRFMEAEENAGEALQNDHSPAIAANKLEVHPKTPFANWLRNELNKRYPHRCTEDNAEYERSPKALTPEGLYKSDKLHQKDDRQRRQLNVLGWDNTEKIRQLDEELRGLQNEIERLKERIQPIENEIDKFNEKLTNAARLADFTDYKTIDFFNIQLEIEELTKEIEKLSQASSAIEILKQQLHQIEGKIKSADDRKGKLQSDRGEIGSVLKGLKTKLHFKKTDAAEYDDPNIQPEYLTAFIDTLPDLDLDTIEKTEREQKNQLDEKIRAAQKSESDLRAESERLMKDFKQPTKALLDQFPSWPNDTDELGNPIIENIGDYLSLLHRIQSDRLPELRERYQARASKDIGNAMQAFQRRLEDQLIDHQDNIRNINQSLRALPYSHDTFLQIVTEENLRKGRIGEFYQLLHSWDYDRAAFLVASETEKLEIWKETVRKIGDIIRRLEGNDLWRKEVTDVRNWLGFKTQQYYIDNNEVVRGTLLDSTGGKSGGEQAKITYTILAAALTYQFNISTGERNARSFRFIVVDEAFSKLDPENSAYLLELLTALKFQMLIITPNTGIATGEKYMSHLIFVKKESESPPSSVAYCYSIKEVKKFMDAR